MGGGGGGGGVVLEYVCVCGGGGGAAAGCTYTCTDEGQAIHISLTCVPAQPIKPVPIQLHGH